ncbi:MAG TPA: hypothetical protein PKD88_08890 [Nitrosomonas sp.]|nr:hypothetical protein [Nitrosomonas sp.]HMW21112.1 hypothetical protein [Nitrosomonas sp.]HMW69405.1 hypothetical protein [Nitrosomonas sp.]HMY61790.1 hypothetical protein [Nitrosomonas sp.]HMY90434.1 hypothetical protein [Nitrosomonas sp.]
MKKLSLILVITTIMLVSSFNLMAACAPWVQTRVTQPDYAVLDAALTSAIQTRLKNKLNATKDEPTYSALRIEAEGLAATIANGRVVITMPDGTVVVDTSKGANNTYDNFKAKTINENHNSRIAILHSQLYDCGLGLETKLSTTDNTKENYLARRLGAYLNSAGTVRLSQKL